MQKLALVYAIIASLRDVIFLFPLLPCVFFSSFLIPLKCLQMKDFSSKYFAWHFVFFPDVLFYSAYFLFG